jgi:hypothetical protein
LYLHNKISWVWVKSKGRIQICFMHILHSCLKKFYIIFQVHLHFDFNSSLKVSGFVTCWILDIWTRNVQLILLHTTWKNLENVTPDERNQSKQITYCFIPFIYSVQNRQIQRAESRLEQEAGAGSDCQQIRSFSFGVMKML